MKHRPVSEDLCYEISFHCGITDQEFPCGTTVDATPGPPRSLTNGLRGQNRRQGVDL